MLTTLPATGDTPAARHDWSVGEIESIYTRAAARPGLPGPDGPSGAPRAQPGPGLRAAERQERRLPGGLRVLPAVGALLDRRRSLRADERGRRARRGAAGARAGRHAVLHGGGLARRRRGRGVRPGARHGARRPGPRDGGLLHARHADAAAGGRAGGGGAVGVQPQPGHLARVLRQHHHHARLRRAPRHDRARAPGRHHRLLRRHHRHGRDAARAVGAAPPAGVARPASRKRAGEHAGPRRRHAARRSPRRRIRWSWSAPSRRRAS